MSTNSEISTDRHCTSVKENHSFWKMLLGVNLLPWQAETNSCQNARVIGVLAGVVTFGVLLLCSITVSVCSRFQQYLTKWLMGLRYHAELGRVRYLRGPSVLLLGLMAGVFCYTDGKAQITDEVKAIVSEHASTSGIYVKSYSFSSTTKHIILSTKQVLFSEELQYNGEKQSYDNIINTYKFRKVKSLGKKEKKTTGEGGDPKYTKSGVYVRSYIYYHATHCEVLYYNHVSSSVEFGVDFLYRYPIQFQHVTGNWPRVSFYHAVFFRFFLQNGGNIIPNLEKVKSGNLELDVNDGSDKSVTITIEPPNQSEPIGYKSSVSVDLSENGENVSRVTGVKVE